MSKLSNLAPVAAATLLAATAAAQACSVNVHPIRLVTANGVPAPIMPDPLAPNRPYAAFANENVYVAFDPTTPSGTYYIHVTDVLGPGPVDVVLSRNDPMDRFVTIQNDNGVISLSLPFTNNPNPAVFGLGLNGVGQSLLVSPFESAPHAPCEFAVQWGDTWNLNLGTEWPYIVRNGFNAQLGRCSINSYAIFRVGDGTGTDVSGTVFLDANRDAALGAGEAGVAGLTVQLVGPGGTLTTVADANGHYTFVDVPVGSYSLELISGTAYVPTGSSTKAVEVCGCGDIGGQDFGVDHAVLTCNPRPLDYWINLHGLQRVQQNGILPTLPALHLVNTFGCHIAPGNLTSFRWYLMLTNSLNMAYRLSAEVLVMHCNVMSGLVDPMCVVNDPVLGQMTVADLLANSIASVSAHPLTFWCHPHRNHQTRLKNALLNANLNRNWL